MKWFILFSFGCGKPSGGMGVMGSPPDTASPSDAAGLQFIEGGNFPLGETDPSIIAVYAAEGEHQTIIPATNFAVGDFYIDGYPFPGVAGADWFTDGTRHNTIEALELTLAQYGRRVCAISELMYAAAGPDNLRYPYGNQWIDRVCDPDDANPQPIGTYTDCKSPLGIHDFQVRSTWGRMGDQLIAVMSETTQQGGFPGDLTYAVWGGTSRDDTFHAPSNFGFHTHDRMAEDLYLDDGFRVCADAKPTNNQNIAYQRWIEDALDAGSYEALFD